MPEKDPKLEALREQGTLNPRPRDVTDPLFATDGFYDPRDLVQVKYEMLRRVQSEGHSVTGAATAFGFSRPSFYQALSAFEEGGLAGLVPHKRGPKQAHKLTDEVLDFIIETRQKQPSRAHSGIGALDPRAFRDEGSSTKHRTQPAASSKKTPLNECAGHCGANPDLTEQYEQLRREATSCSEHRGEGLGLALFLRRGMTAWMQAWSQCTDRVAPKAPLQPAMAAVPIDLRTQVATLLAGIILGLHQEAPHEWTRA